LSNSDGIVLEGTTLAVYVYIAKEGKSVGPRDVMRRLHLNSPSVAYRHLQKLEDSGLLTKTEYGEYSLKKKAKIRGYHWIGRTLLPNIFFFFYPFLAILIAELVVLAIHFGVETYEFKVFLLLGITITAIAMVAFLVIGIVEIRKISRSTSNSPTPEVP
jgi:hypothetical protein